MKPAGAAPPRFPGGFASFSVVLMLGTLFIALFALPPPAVQPSSTVLALATNHGPAAFDWATLPVQQWIRLPTTGEAPRKVFHGAAALASDRQEIFFFGDDTHYTDYDNSVVRLDLRSLRWSRDYEADPTTTYRLTAEGYAVTTSGRPWAMHTFDAWDYDPVRKKLLAVGSSKHAYRVLEQLLHRDGPTKEPQSATWWYDPDQKCWELTQIASPDLFAYGLVWDPLGQQFIGHDGRATYHYQAGRNQWVTYLAGSVSGWNRKLVFDTFAGRVLTLGHSGGSNVLYSYNPKTHNRWEVVRVRGQTLPGNGAALAYDTTHHVMLYLANESENQYDNPSGKSRTFLYAADTQAWTQLAVESPELYGMNYLTQYDPVRHVFLHFEKSRDSQGRVAAWAFRYQ